MVTPQTFVRRFPDSPTLLRAAAEELVAIAREAVATRGQFIAVLAGGSTPRGMYQLLATEELARQVDWQRIQLCFGDERCVPPEHPDSNFGMARNALLSRVPIPPQNVHRIRGEAPPKEAAEEYERTLRMLLSAPAADGHSAGRFDLVLLGMGEDGHTASLFPGSPLVHERRRWVAEAYVEHLNAWRVTLTPAALETADRVRFLVTGRGKAETLARVLEGPHDPEWLPAQAIRPAGGELVWLIDAEAASRLRSGPMAAE